MTYQPPPVMYQNFSQPPNQSQFGGGPQTPPMNYQQTPQMQQPTGAPPVKEVYDNNNGPREWRFGLFDCFADTNLFLKTFCCPCVTYGETKARMLNDESACLVNGLLYAFVGCVVGPLNRNEMRTQLNIEGSGAGDLCTHYCFSYCALIQENREANAM
nr:342_t:CDS:2 [Entrophospora candida]